MQAHIYASELPPSSIRRIAERYVRSFADLNSLQLVLIVIVVAAIGSNNNRGLIPNALRVVFELQRSSLKGGYLEWRIQILTPKGNSPAASIQVKKHDESSAQDTVQDQVRQRVVTDYGAFVFLTFASNVEIAPRSHRV